MPDPLEALRGQPIIPLAPREEFARELLGRLERAVATIEGDTMSTTDVVMRPLLPAMAHIWTADPDASIGFFAQLFDWASIRTEGDQVTHYVHNVEVGDRVRTGHRGRPMPVLHNSSTEFNGLQFAVADLPALLRTVVARGGWVDDPGATEYTEIHDGEGLGHILWRAPRAGDYPSPSTPNAAGAVPAYFELRVADVASAAHFYGSVFGWQFERSAAADRYDVVDGGQLVVTVVRVATGEAPEIRHYFGVPRLDDVESRVRGLGGRVEARYSTPRGAAVDATDAYGARFRLVEIG